MRGEFIMKYAIYQMDVVTADPEANREKIHDWVNERVKQDKPDMIVLPEMWNTGYALAELENTADKDAEPTISFLSDLAKKNNINIIGGSVGNKKTDRFYNTSLRSEEHTSELQSRFDLVCRLLLV